MTDSNHQSLMDVAYDTWKQNKDWSYSDFIESLDQQTTLAVLTGNLNKQVENGGFYQWHTNEYDSESNKLLVLLGFHKKEPIVSQVLTLVEKAVKIIDKYDSEISEEEDDESEEVEYLNSLMSSELGELDGKYYKINDEFMNYMETVFSNQQAI